MSHITAQTIQPVDFHGKMPGKFFVKLATLTCLGRAFFLARHQPPSGEGKTVKGFSFRTFCGRYWCADQMMVQKALSAKSLSDAQGATILTGWIKVLH